MGRSLKILSYTLLIASLIGAYIFFKKAQGEYSAITTFEQCIEAGYPVLPSYPEECKIPGKIFTNLQQTEHIQPIEVATDTPQAPISDYKNTSYTIDGQRVLLKEGYSTTEQNSMLEGTGTPVVTVSIFGKEIVTDFDQNTFTDTASILKSESSATSTYYYIAMALSDGTSVSGTNAIFIGDRITPLTSVYKDGEIVISYYDRGVNEPVTVKPTRMMTRHFKLLNGRLVEVLKAIH